MEVLLCACGNAMPVSIFLV